MPIVLLMNFNALFFVQVSKQVTLVVTRSILDKDGVAPPTDKDDDTGSNGNVVLFSAAFALSFDMVYIFTFMVKNK